MATLPRKREAGLARPPRMWAVTAGLVMVLVFSILGPWMTYSEVPGAGEGSPVRQGAYFLALALAIYGMRPVENPRRLLVVPVTLLVLLGWCWLTTIGAVAPGVSVRRLVLTCVVIWTLFVAVDQLGYERSLLILRIVLAATLVLNFAAVLVAPDFAIHSVAEPGDKRLIGDWRGILMHKNFAGAVCSLTILLFVFDARRIPMAARGAVIAAAAVFLVFTESKTSEGLLVPAVLAGLFFQYYGAKYRAAAVSLICVGIVALAGVFSLYPHAFEINFDDREAFTGRTQIWKPLLSYYSDHAPFGAGYGSFWNVGPAGPIYHYATGWVVEVTSGHNGFIDLLVTIGLPGVVLAVIAGFVAPIARLLTIEAIPPARGALVLALVVFCMSHNNTESSLLDRDSIVEVVLMFAIALLGPLSAVAARRSGQPQGFSLPKLRTETA